MLFYNSRKKESMFDTPLTKLASPKWVCKEATEKALRGKEEAEGERRAGKKALRGKEEVEGERTAGKKEEEEERAKEKGSCEASPECLPNPSFARDTVRYICSFVEN